MVATLRSVRWRVPFAILLMLQPFAVAMVLVATQSYLPRGSDITAINVALWVSAGLGVFGSSWLSPTLKGKLLGVLVYTPIAIPMLVLLVIGASCALGIDCL